MENTIVNALGKTVAASGPKNALVTFSASRVGLAIFWVLTLYIVVTQLAAGTLNLLHAPPLYDLLLRLGYPPHFATLLGTWKILGALVFLVPRFPLAKEWAYAGMFIDYSAAMVAHAAAGDSIVTQVGPLVSLGALVATWYLRPKSRRLI